MTQSDFLTIISIVVTGIGSVAGVIGLMFVWGQLRGAQQIARGEFLLHLDELLRTHERAYRTIMTPGWTPDRDGVTEADIENYMTLFEQFKILIDYKIIDFAIFDRLYAYRVMLLVVNDHIHHQLIEYAIGWPDFIQLCKHLADAHRTNTLPPSVWTERWILFVQRVDALPVIVR